MKLLAFLFALAVPLSDCVQTYTVRSVVPRTVKAGQAVEIFDSFQVDKTGCYSVYDIDRTIWVPGLTHPDGTTTGYQALYHLWDDHLAPGMTDTQLRPVYRVAADAQPGDVIWVKISVTWTLKPGGPKVLPGIETSHQMLVVK